MPNKIKIYNPMKVTVAPNPVKIIERQEKKPAQFAAPKAQRLMNQSAKMTQKDETIKILKPKFVKLK